MGGNAGKAESEWGMLLYAKFGIVLIIGERAQGLVEVKSCSRVGSIYLDS